MPDYLHPGVYVEETTYRAKAVEPVSTDIAAFVGPTLTGPLAAGDDPLPLLTTMQAFEAAYGGLDDLTIEGAVAPNYVARAARAFFEEGGRRLYIARTPPSPTADCYAEALRRLKTLPDVSMVAAPGVSARPDLAEAVADALVAHAETASLYRFAFLDPPPGSSVDGVRALRARWDSRRAALYYPWPISPDPLATPKNRRPIQLPVPPSGAVCGLYAASDLARGVWKAPSSPRLVTAVDLEHRVTFGEQEVLNPEGVDCLRLFEGKGVLLYGARSLSTDSEAKYVAFNRYRLYLEDSLARGLQWAVFEPNGERLWAQVRAQVEAFLYDEWRRGALLGDKPEKAYFVKCDRTTMTQTDLDQGRLVCLYGVAQVKPAEFVIARVGQKTADAAA